MSPAIIRISEIEAKRLITSIISNNLKEHSLNVSKTNGSYDLKSINQALGNILSLANNELQANEMNYIEYSVPLGSFIDNPLFVEYGPKIPLKIKLIGEVMGHIESQVKEYGINSALITISIVLEAEVSIIAPFILNYMFISVDYPLVIDIIDGQVPALLPYYEIK